MSGLKTQDNKSLVVVNGSSSVVDERIITSNSASNQLGSTITFTDVIGDGDRTTTQLMNLYFETTLHINSTVSNYELLHLCSLWEYIELYINGVRAYSTNSIQVQRDFMYMHQLMDTTNNSLEFINELQELGATLGEIDPFTNGSTSTVVDGTNSAHRVAGIGRNISFDLCQLFPDVFKNLKFHRVKQWSLQIRYRADSGAALARYLKYNLVSPDTNPSQLPVFTSTQLRMKYRRTRPMSDPIPASLPMVMVMDRHELKNFGAVFNGSVASYKMSLAQNAGWTNIKNIDTSYIYFRSPTNVNRSWSNSCYLSDLLGFKVYINGKVYSSYMNGQFRNYVNAYNVKKTGHYPYYEPRNAINDTPIVFLSELNSAVRVDWTGIIESLGDKKHDIAIVGGIDNYANTYEIEVFCNLASFATGGPREGHTLECVCTSKTLISVYNESRVESSFT